MQLGAGVGELDRGLPGREGLRQALELVLDARDLHLVVAARAVPVLVDRRQVLQEGRVLRGVLLALQGALNDPLDRLHVGRDLRRRDVERLRQRPLDRLLLLLGRGLVALTGGREGLIDLQPRVAERRDVWRGLRLSPRPGGNDTHERTDCQRRDEKSELAHWSCPFFPALLCAGTQIAQDPIGRALSPPTCATSRSSPCRRRCARASRRTGTAAAS